VVVSGAVTPKLERPARSMRTPEHPRRGGWGSAPVGVTSRPGPSPPPPAVHWPPRGLPGASTTWLARKAHGARSGQGNEKLAKQAVVAGVGWYVVGRDAGVGSGTRPSGIVCRCAAKAREACEASCGSLGRRHRQARASRSKQADTRAAPPKRLRVSSPGLPAADRRQAPTRAIWAGCSARFADFCF
jgi:hypothetical protein